MIFVCLAVNNKIKVPPGAEELVGRAVEHLFEKEDGEKNEWRGMVLSRAPIMTHWYYITYEKDPVLYMYQLWDDYKDGDLRVLPESGTVMRDLRTLIMFLQLTKVWESTNLNSLWGFFCRKKLLLWMYLVWVF